MIDPFDLRSGRRLAEWHTEDRKKWMWLDLQTNDVVYYQEIHNKDVLVYRFP